jgi:anti-anti-sigma regulatory factor
MATKQSKRKRESSTAGTTASDTHGVAVSQQMAADTLSYAESLVAGTEVAEMSNASTTTQAANGGANDMIALPTSCTVRDSAALKAELLPLFEHDNVVTIDVRAVERIDTAVLQVLIAFVRDRSLANRVTNWVGEPECLTEAVSVLGISEALQLRSENAMAAVA